MTDITSLKGIGEKTAGALSRLGISCVEELVTFYPRDYEEFPAPTEIYKLIPGTVGTVECVLGSPVSINRYNGMVIANVYISDMGGRLQISWYNMPYIRSSLKQGEHYVFRGRVYEKNGRRIMSQPKIYRAEDYKKGYQGRLMPVYRLCKGVNNRLIMKTAAEALRTPEALKLTEEFLPRNMIAENHLMAEPEAVRAMHFPKSREELFNARNRLSFDEFLLFMLLKRQRRELYQGQSSSYRCRPDIRILKLAAELPFELTKDQSSAFKDISRDLSSGKVMNRLLEGDVGSGKTIVAFLAMIYAGLCGYQSVIMAPTEVLARQHYESLTALLEGRGLGLKAVFLCGSMTRAEKEEAYSLIREQRAQLIIGTHALFQENVEYKSLGLVVTDEQHRFGVSQRETMKRKGGLPHMLLMSATPIPRTLSMILYGDMDVSVIKERPEGRLPIKNTVVGPEYRRNAYKFIYDEIKKGHRAYIVCPAIEREDEEEALEASGLGGDGAELCTVEEQAEKLRKLFPKEVRIGTLHGRMKAQEKEAAMAAFKEGLTDILISTTVIEVGVDVPEATVMMIENAERFGLSQLHQLRGRVGRGDAQSYCIMINTSRTEEAAERLGIIRASNDGFFIASEDLRLRGPGDLFGVRQSGELGFMVADIYRDETFLHLAEKAAEELMLKDAALSEPEHEGIARRLSAYMERSFYDV
ncbi:MAG TPA: ATP-dependent DNA helicase RecG [Candidatus Avilachnospira avistercoris]|nr:ATP-dependent DNA helicase RecG [Candidatus Avilachnospira avistercoris]